MHLTNGDLDQLHHVGLVFEQGQAAVDADVGHNAVQVGGVDFRETEFRFDWPQQISGSGWSQCWNLEFNLKKNYFK